MSRYFGKDIKARVHNLMPQEEWDRLEYEALNKPIKVKILPIVNRYRYSKALDRDDRRQELNDFISECCEYYGISISSFIHKKRTPEFSKPRRDIIQLALKKGFFPLELTKQFNFSVSYIYLTCKLSLESVDISNQEKIQPANLFANNSVLLSSSNVLPLQMP